MGLVSERRLKSANDFRLDIILINLNNYLENNCILESNLKQFQRARLK